MSKEFEIILLKLNNLEKDSKEQKEFQKIVLKQLDEQKKFNKEILKRFETLERTVTIIEDEVKNNIPALFNADLTRQPKEDSLQSEVDHLR